ncbi:MAG: thiolase family protein [Acidimicrobiaceae bacterium]|nr:beta-ketoacyl synthase N-terminal-like domain-containing protein [Acidimicrobiaceae bacterium]MXW75537.1 thiolase family protein [Acidimicrobiaceae bacterium]MYA73193.1 thiolase family protein [Acidimicrobiaceae bacterium]MYD05881.1 thiolase family protein [Acidimicrobiaceae bacterium]MYG54993.1 thiolase family protein [Acidimicrobiaceae bacterium]
MATTKNSKADKSKASAAKISDDSVWILGTNMTRFGRYPDQDVVDLAAEASMAALQDGNVTIHDMDVLAAGSLFNASTGMGQRIQKQIGQTGIPVFNVTNACATGATALRTVYLSIKAGEADMGLAVGVEQMGKMGLLGGAGTKKEKKVFEPSGRYGAVTGIDGYIGTEGMPGVFAQAGMEYANDYDGVGFEQFARVAYKNHLHSTLNPLAQYRKEFSMEEIMTSPTMSYPNTLLMCCPTGDGAAAAVLVSGQRLKSMPLGVRRRAVKISASVLTSDPYTESSQVQPDVNTLTRNAAAKAYETAGVGPEDLDLVELHDCFATAELIHYDNLGLCERGTAGDFIDSGAPFRDGTTPVNVSGGLISKGHPIGATGVANVYEVTTHLRGEAEDRQIPDAKVGLAHVIGLGSACGIHILEKAAV